MTPEPVTPATEAPVAPTPGVPTTGTGPITLEDVRIALGDTDPKSTNAGKLRKILGRGSFETIQRHLEQMRKERAPVLPGTQAPPPPLPKDLMEAIWSSAWASSQAATYGRTERLSAERDGALELSATRASDIVGLTADLDGLLEKVAAAEGHAAELSAKAQADIEAAAQAAAETAAALERVTEEKDKAQADAAHAAAQAAAEAAKALEQVKAEKAKVEADAAHAAQLATRDAQIAAQAMQSTIDRLNDQIGDLKGLLIARTAPAPVTNQTPPQQ